MREVADLAEWRGGATSAASHSSPVSQSKMRLSTRMKGMEAVKEQLRVAPHGSLFLRNP